MLNDIIEKGGFSVNGFDDSEAKKSSMDNFLINLGCSMSKWSEKVIIWFAKSYKASESSKPSQICWTI